MSEFVVHGLELLIKLLEICGAGLLILGFVIATWQWVQRIHREGQSSALRHYRRSLGRSVLIGLEVLVIATIIKTIIVEPSFEGLGLLAGMVVIRTILGWTTALEISGRWPWQKPRAEIAPSQTGS